MMLVTHLIKSQPIVRLIILELDLYLLIDIIEGDPF